MLVINMINKVSSGSKVIDELLNGGFERGVISTIFGPAGTGKSNIAMLIALKVANQGKKVIFIDTEGGFSAERASQLAPDKYKALLKNIILFEPTSFDEQKKVFEKLNDVVNKEKVGLIVIDSIVMLYRLQRGSDEEVSVTNKELANQLAILSSIARKKSIAVLTTNQVYADFEKPNNFHMVGGDLLKYWSKCIVKLESIERVRKASIFKHRSLPEKRKVFFEIIGNGLKEVKYPKKKFSLF
ncbi:DNA repair and recombination protein RadB [Candidatus Woesearchaeota archaeon]|nr:DNA repair and recombination protein RadB [Candidatus Woesearchaeota archaeon]